LAQRYDRLTTPREEGFAITDPELAAHIGIGTETSRGPDVP
jgi:hypothetical protein